MRHQKRISYDRCSELPSGLKRDAERLAKAGRFVNQFILWSVAEKVGGLLRGLDDPDFANITYRRRHLALYPCFAHGSGTDYCNRLPNVSPAEIVDMI
jgi:hypothetical protein